jgi:hypothetical protein
MSGSSTRKQKVNAVITEAWLMGLMRDHIKIRSFCSFVEVIQVILKGHILARKP